MPLTSLGGLTMQGIGFTDEVHRADVDAIADAARDRCAALAPFTIALGPAPVPEAADGFRPHVSLAYSNTAGPAEPIIQRLGARSVTAAEITVRRAALIDLNRDHRAYEWNDIATADLSAPTS